MAGNALELRNRELMDTNKALLVTIEDLRALLKKTTEQNETLQQQVDYLTKKLFGTSSEKRKHESEGQLSFFDEVEQEANSTDPEPECEDIPDAPKTRKSRSKRAEMIRGIRIEPVIESLRDDQKVCDVCGAEMKPGGKKYLYDELVFQRAKVYIIRHYAETAYCPQCKTDGEKNNIVTADAKRDPLLPRSWASPSVVSHIMYEKYANAVPLYRQEKDWLQYGVPLSRAVQARWTMQCSEKYFTPMYDFFHRKMLQRTFLMADETRTQVLKEPGREPETDSFVWLFRTGEDGEPPIILYGYTETRAKYNAEAFLNGFSGYLMTDGYQGYNNLPGIRRTCCWDHVRRYFLDAIPKGKSLDFSNPAVQGVQFCDKLSWYERYAREHHYTSEQRYEYRLKKETPVLEAFWSWLDRQNPIKNSRMDKAVTYVWNRKPFLTTYLEDGRCSYSNNLSENSIRPFCVGRRNWLFSDTPKGATASATIYTMVEMAKVYDLNIHAYLEFLLESRPSKAMSDEELERFAPWNEEVKKRCGNGIREDVKM